MRALALAAALVAGAACLPSAPLQLKLEYVLPPGIYGDPEVIPCRLAITGVVDARAGFSRDTVGFVGGVPVLAERVPEWVAQGLRVLPVRGVAVISEAAVGADDFIADVLVQKVYARAAVSQFEAVVVLRARYVRFGRALATRDYRGSAHKVNWVGGDGEVVDTLNLALEDVVSKMASDFQSICRHAPAPEG